VIEARHTVPVAVFALALGLLAAAAPADQSEDDRQAVQAVCGRCHSTDLFKGNPQSWERWNDVFADMTQRGATGTDEQLMRVTRYFLENLTLVNVNTAPADELAGILSAPEQVVEAIIARRHRRPFANLDDLRAIPGIDGKTVETRKDRILF
jgi:competence ComEA-like helix-hairpin-helix protein